VFENRRKLESEEVGLILLPCRAFEVLRSTASCEARYSKSRRSKVGEMGSKSLIHRLLLLHHLKTTSDCSRLMKEDRVSKFDDRGIERRMTTFPVEPKLRADPIREISDSRSRIHCSGCSSCSRGHRGKVRKVEDLEDRRLKKRSLSLDTHLLEVRTSPSKRLVGMIEQF
jgi:hypothetical protein